VHVHLLTPLRRRPPGAGRVASCCGTRLARVGCLQEEGGGLRPLEPPISRAQPAAAANPQQAHLSKSSVYSCVNRSLPKRQAFKMPRCPLCFHRPRGLRKLAHAGVVPVASSSAVPRTPWNTFSIFTSAGTLAAVPLFSCARFFPCARSPQRPTGTPEGSPPLPVPAKAGSGIRVSAARRVLRHARPDACAMIQMGARRNTHV
jgi:hypothetical protein